MWPRVLAGITVLLFVTILPSKLDLNKNEAIFFRTVNQGQDWQAVTELKKAERVLDLALNPQNPSEIYLASEKGLYVSFDNGKSWQVKEIKISNQVIEDLVIYQIAVDPVDSRNIYLATYLDGYGQALASYDKGKSWRALYISTFQKEPFYALGVNMSQEIYLAGASGDLLKSANFGQSWQVVKKINEAILQINLTDSEIYIRTSNEIFKKSNEKWQELEIEARQINDFITTERNLYLASNKGFFKSNNKGKSWQEIKVAASGEEVSKVAVDLNNFYNLYCSVGANLYFSYDNGQSWQMKKFSENIEEILVNLKNKDIIYVGTSSSNKILNLF